ncbi:polyphosphate kinase 1 [Methanosphaerula palustris]|uniref:Polyphosphate kinase n=1 Tax=Methanosphaerula palustris (strain ATCC BAA-1556 / DSM 19958 / E1-9c) TaxID=521011 RepID=B8GKW6_METPE|nr:polyphosphate kinase 1 [Methanosphaerula palustris]ACL17262.1 Polyphosphate kinase [Methanosphaerula palustris E1-9c]
MITPSQQQSTGSEFISEGSDEERALFFNRELSWIAFNRRVLEEALDQTHPLLERVKFLAIFATNLDEFFMIRVAGLQRLLHERVVERPPDGMTAFSQLNEIRALLLPQLMEQMDCWHQQVKPQLAASGIHIHSYSSLSSDRKESLRAMFEREIFPVLTPLAFDTSHPFPFISNLSLNLAILVEDPEEGDCFARLKIPVGLFPRLIEFRAEKNVTQSLGGGEHHYVLLEDLIAANLDLLFPGLRVVAAYPFRVTRNADLEIEEDEASDLMTAIEESMEMRRVGSPVRIEMDRRTPEAICSMVVRHLGISPDMIYRLDEPIGMADMMMLAGLNRPDLQDPPFHPSIPPSLSHDQPIFPVIQRGDLLLYHPYDSFGPVITFLQQAATDPDVLAIKMTLYRVGSNSPIVDALMEARENGKQVTALIELKARFDEENNIGWARALERAGVHVVYGLVGIKVHAKVCLVVRREKQGIVRYIHLGTGNYNAGTSRVYTDIGLMTASTEIGADISDLFNFLTGYARITSYRKLLVAPVTIRDGILQRIEREIVRHQEHGDGYIAFKMNALVDRACILALYRASQAGVRIDLQVRGICCLRPGLPGISETITVTSIVGRFLEHARMYYFRNGGDEEVLVGSADLMPRNLDRRVEILFPIQDKRLLAVIVEDILMVHLRDTAKARKLLPDGTYCRVLPEDGDTPFDTQQWMIDHRGQWYPLIEKDEVLQTFSPLSVPPLTGTGSVRIKGKGKR